MQTLSQDALVELTRRINTRLAEFEGLGTIIPKLTRGIVRICREEVQALEQERNIEEMQKALPSARQLAGFTGQLAGFTGTLPSSGYHGDVTVNHVAEVVNGNGTHKQDEPLFRPVRDWPGVKVALQEPAEQISDETAATLGAEHTIVTPFASEESDERKLAKLDPEHKAARLREIINELRMLSPDGEMPTQAVYDDKKAIYLPKSQAVIKSYNLTWAQIAEYADLHYDRRGKQKGE